MKAQQIIDSLNEHTFTADEIMDIYLALLKKMAPADRVPMQRNTGAPVADFKVGEVVRLSTNCSTRYLRGKQARIVKFGRTRVHLELLVPEGRFTGVFNAPPSLIVKIDQPAQAKG